MSVAALLMPLVGTFKAQKKDKAKIDTYDFMLHYKATVSILCLCSLLVTATSLIGKPISCVPGTDGLSEKVLHTYCWISFTFSVPPQKMIGSPSKEAKEYLGQEYAYPGSQPYIKGKSGDKIYHAYYQWVALSLLIQAAFFYAPHLIWKILEDKTMSKLTKRLRGRKANMEDQKQDMHELIRYLTSTLNTHNWYAIKYIFCSFLNLANLLMQCYLVNEFLGKAFMSYGTDYLKWTQLENEERIASEDPMIKVFPQLTKCTFHKYGHSGTIEAHDALCVLAQNVINEKIYITLWLWFLVLGIVTVLGLIRIAAFFFFPVSPITARIFGLNVSIVKARKANKKPNYGDWFMIHQLSKNMNKILFNDFINEFQMNLSNDSYNPGA